MIFFKVELPRTSRPLFPPLWAKYSLLSCDSSRKMSHFGLVFRRLAIIPAHRMLFASLAQLSLHIFPLKTCALSLKDLNRSTYSTPCIANGYAVSIYILPVYSQREGREGGNGLKVSLYSRCAGIREVSGKDKLLSQELLCIGTTSHERTVITRLGATGQGLEVQKEERLEF